ncbi:hypothetical protein [Lacisediminihabitans profunda]|uniref:Uncharacterized protein n=1 Tax=Lacisediminihabitans profunda TaxID=2594790 RepID=A0A5C8UJY0_9MICO|nr:hypothetical protein [Lacisediminihabitans profunda]TXN28095.1 hypothetical protein FVP33_18275 [Lacisediminihabitans profunda]
MDWQFAGLPLHVLLVHFVVIVVPLAALCTVLAAAWPAARRRLGVVTPLIALAALVSVPVTTEAGEWLLARVSNTPLIQAHAAIGKSLLPWAFATFVVATGQWAWFRYFSEGDGRYRRLVAHRSLRLAITIALGVAVLGLAAGSIVTVVQIGESGARAIWTGSYTPNPR